MGLHIEYCKEFGVSKEEIEATEESQGMKLNEGHQQD
jgi:ATP-dependent RNA helicase DDX5/DBP2